MNFFRLILIYIFFAKLNANGVQIGTYFVNDPSTLKAVQNESHFKNDTTEVKTTTNFFNALNIKGANKTLNDSIIIKSQNSVELKAEKYQLKLTKTTKKIVMPVVEAHKLKVHSNERVTTNNDLDKIINDTHENAVNKTGVNSEIMNEQKKNNNSEFKVHDIQEKDKMTTVLNKNYVHARIVNKNGQSTHNEPEIFKAVYETEIINEQNKINNQLREKINLLTDKILEKKLDIFKITNKKEKYEHDIILYLVKEGVVLSILFILIIFIVFLALFLMNRFIQQNSKITDRFLENACNRETHF